MKQFTKKTIKAAQGGFTLIEAMVVMIVGVVVLAAAAAGIGKLFSTSNVSTEVGNITQMSANLQGLRGPAGYKGLSNELAISYKAIPANMVVSPDSKITNAWNGDVTITSVKEDQSYNIAYTKVPQDACQQIMTKLINAGWTEVKAGTTPLSASSTLAEIKTACTPDKDGASLMSFTG